MAKQKIFDTLHTWYRAAGRLY